MRLGQLARKLAIRPVEIVDFLTGQNIPVDANSNTRLNNDQVALVILQFAPGQAKEVTADLTDEEEADINKVPLVKTVVTGPQTTRAAGTEILTTETSAEKAELIKAPKVELPGLKVLGKIDI